MEIKKAVSRLRSADGEARQDAGRGGGLSNGCTGVGTNEAGERDVRARIAPDRGPAGPGRLCRSKALAASEGGPLPGPWAAGDSVWLSAW